MNNRPGNIWNPAALKRKMPFRYSRIMVFSLWTAFPFLLTAFLSGCAVSKTLPEGTFLYAGSELELKHPDSVSVKQLKPELESLFSPRTNRQLLGYPVRLHFYNLFASEKEKGLFPWLQRILGEPPVLFDEKIPLSVEPLLENRAFNLGYLHPEVQSRLDTGKNNKITVNYEVKVGQPYHISGYQMKIDHPEIERNLSDLPPSKIIEPGRQYTLDELKKERQRVANWLRIKGYFFFDDNYLKFTGDTISGSPQINLTLRLKEEVPSSDLQPQYIDEVTIFPDYGVSRADQRQDQTITVDSIKFVYDEMAIRPKNLLNAILVRPGDRYDLDRHQRTRERLLDQDFFQFVNLRFQRSAWSDSLMNLLVYLTPRQPNTIEGTLGISHKSTGFIGPEASLSFINRNLFGGGERLQLSGRVNLNYPLNDMVNRYYEEIEVGAKITRPGLLLPFLSQEAKDRMIGAGTSVQLRYTREKARFPLDNDSTSVEDIIADLEEFGFISLPEKLRADSTYAPFLGVDEVRITFGYEWKLRRIITHTANPLNFRFQVGTYEDPELEVLVLLGSLLTNRFENILSLQRMFIYQPEYIFTYDSRKRELKRHNYFFRGRIAYAGNEVLPTKKQDLVDLNNIESQFLQLETDWRYFLISPRQHTLASRFIANMSIPFGKELILPYFDFYSVGGPNSIRAFATRQVGPGTVNPENQQLSLLSGKGAIQLESNLEYRRRLNQYFELAGFVDVGNVWLFNERVEEGEGEKGHFEWNNFYKELAVATGLGMRLTLSSLIIRLDFGIPLAKPWKPEGQRWVGNQIRLLSGPWLKENLQWNFAFGYPF